MGKDSNSKDQLLKIKFLLFLEMIYRNKYEVSDINSMNPIEFIRRGDYEGFFESIEKCFRWKAESFRAIYDSNPESKPDSLEFFTQHLKSLIDKNSPLNGESIRQSKKGDNDQSENNFLDMCDALTGNPKKIVRFLKSVDDDHDEMWATLFSSYINKKETKGITRKTINKFTPIEFQQYCYRKDLKKELKDDNIIERKEINEIDPESLAFYFNLAIIFDNKSLKAFLLPTYLSLLYKSGEYECFLKYFPEKIDENSTDYISIVASLNERSGPFLDLLRKKYKDYNIKNLLIKIKNRILKNDKNNYMKALNWLDNDDSIRTEYLQLAIDITYKLVFENKFLEAYETFKKIKEDMIENQYNEEAQFWETFLSSNGEKVKESCKKLIIWLSSLKTSYNDEEEQEEEAGGHFYFPYGYKDDGDKKEKTNRLINHLFYYITNKYKEKLNDDIDNGEKI